MGNEKGNRKFKDARESALILLVGFIIAAWLKADAQLYFGLIFGVVGKTGLFNWGNVKEHQTENKPKEG